MNFRGALALYNQGVPEDFYQDLSNRGIEDIEFRDVLRLFDAN